jgi:NAD-dependent SIR2 family protein deacetylase
MSSLDDNKVQKLYELLSDGSYKSIVFVLGAGISVSAGIPDFRSPGGLFEAVKNNFGDKFPELMAKPEHLLSREFCNENPDVWNNEVVPMLRSWKLEETYPTITHKLLAWIYNQGWLTRVYTQNIDGLELHSDVVSMTTKQKVDYCDFVIQAHGSMRDGTIVLYGDSLPPKFYLACEKDFKSPEKPVDLVIVMGTSLQVAPFCAIPNLVPDNATRILVDPFPNRVKSSNQWSENTTIQLSGRKVKIASLWENKNSPWKNEILIESTSDDFVKGFFESSYSREKGFSIKSSLGVEYIQVISKRKKHLCQIIYKIDNNNLFVRRCIDGKQVSVPIKKCEKL